MVSVVTDSITFSIVIFSSTLVGPTTVLSSVILSIISRQLVLAKSSWFYHYICVRLIVDTLNFLCFSYISCFVRPFRKKKLSVLFTIETAVFSCLNSMFHLHNILRFHPQHLVTLNNWHTFCIYTFVFTILHTIWECILETLVFMKFQFVVGIDIVHKCTHTSFM